ncbi:MAG: 3-isopropylmalate dehydrogenase [Chloroflexi bacterium]|nr:3-isopropylmalate dehydrogenase [Chloroflexota bacterium]
MGAPTSASGHVPHIAVLAGDGIGTEVVEVGLRVLQTAAEAYGWNFSADHALIGGAAIDATGSALPDATLHLASRADAVYFGAVGGPKWDNPLAKVRPEQGILGLRKALDLYANLRPVKLSPSLLSHSVLKEDIVRGTDMIVVRELTGGLYFGKPSRRWQSPTGWRAVDTLAYSEQEIERVLRTSFDLARLRRKKVTSVDKANVLTTGRFWREIANRVAVDYPDVTLEHILVDSAAMYLIRRPASFDVVVTENMFGDILTDEASVLAGSMGMLPSASLGSQRNSLGGVQGLYEPIHGTALYTPEVVGTGRANPIAAILSAALMLRYSLALPAVADAIEHAVETILEAGFRTSDIAGPGTEIVVTDRMGELIAAEIARAASSTQKARITAPTVA